MERKHKQWAREIKKRAYTVKNACDKNAGEYRPIIAVEYKSAELMSEIINELTKRLGEELNELRVYEKEVKQKIKAIENMEVKYRNVSDEIGKYNFGSAGKIMGKRDIYLRI